METSEILGEFCSLFENYGEKPNIIDWVEKNIVLVNSYDSGNYSFSKTPHTRDILTTFMDDEVRKVVWVASSQVAKTTSIISLINYVIKNDPSPILFITSTENLVEDFSKNRFTGTLNESSNLRNIIESDRSDTVTLKAFRGGYIYFTTPVNVSDLSSRAIKYVFADEMSYWKDHSAIRKAEKRTTTYLDHKLFYTGTPTIEGGCLVTREYLKGDQRQYHVPCPFCGEKQVLDWKRIKYKGVREVVYECIKCKKKIEEKHKALMLEKGVWIPKHHRGREVVSYRLNELSSNLSSWDRVVKNWLDSKDQPHDLRDFINLTLAETWKENSGYTSFDRNVFVEQREKYLADVPEGVLLLTCGVDVQDDRLEYEVVGYGVNDESWGIEYQKIIGSPWNQETWDDLELRLQKRYSHESGGEIGISSALIDSGFATSMVYHFTKRNRHFRWFPSKGSNENVHPVYKVSVRKIREGVRLIMVGTNQVKDLIFSRIKEHNEKGGRMHFPVSDHYGKDYFDSLFSEVKVKKIDAKGYASYSWIKKTPGIRNEVLDCRVLAEVAKALINPDYLKLKERGKFLSAKAGSGRKKRRMVSRGF